jgi:hypothetical protein
MVIAIFISTGALFEKGPDLLKHGRSYGPMFARPWLKHGYRWLLWDMEKVKRLT